MKKLKLKLDGMKEMLTKEQMRKINGGYSSPSVSCYTWCDLGPDASGGEVVFGPNWMPDATDCSGATLYCAEFWGYGRDYEVAASDCYCY